MNDEKFKAAYSASRNGTDTFHFNPLYRKFNYSDGVKECAEAGCYWLLDILGTELPGVFRRYPDDTLMIVKVMSAGSKAQITGSFTDDSIEYQRKVDYTDMPEGEWMFYVSCDHDEDGTTYHCILPTEY